MAAAYDTFDYPSYWQERGYEHESEVIAVNALLDNIPKINKILDIGGGFGRLTPQYILRAKRVFLTDPSTKLLGLARKNLKNYNNIKFVQTTAENLDHKFRASSFDTIFIVRVMHHIKNAEAVCKTIVRLLKKNGYLIMEFPNKVHGKAVITNFLKGDFTFPLDIFTTDKTIKKSNVRTLPFNNYHPHVIEQMLKKYSLEIIDKRSVSNIRSPFLKKNLPIKTLIDLERSLQKPLSKLNFGPSIFILARKRG